MASRMDAKKFHSVCKAETGLVSGSFEIDVALVKAFPHYYRFHLTTTHIANLGTADYWFETGCQQITG
jgi:hypothetical protein